MNTQSKTFYFIFALAFLMVSCSDSAPETEEITIEEEAPVEVIESTPAIATEFISEDNSFSITFPGTPERDTETVPTEIGDIELVTYMYEPSLSKVYMVAYSAYPSALIELSDDATLLMGGKEGAIGSLGIATIEEEKDIELDGYSGLYFKGFNSENFYVEYELYMKGNRLYQVAIMQDGSYPTEPEDAEFFNSFSFVSE